MDGHILSLFAVQGKDSGALSQRHEVKAKLNKTSVDC